MFGFINIFSWIKVLQYRLIKDTYTMCTKELTCDDFMDISYVYSFKIHVHKYIDLAIYQKKIQLGKITIDNC